MKLYEYGPTRSLRVRWVLQELGVEFESVTVDMSAGEHRKAEFLRINPAGKLPAFTDGGLTLTESAAIVLYLAEKYPQKRLLPASLTERAEHSRWLLFTVTELEQPLWRIARHTFVYPKAQRLEGDVAIARGEFKEMAKVLDEHMRTREFLVGDSATVADFILAYTLDWANEEELLADYPRLRSYLDRMYARPQAPMRIAEASAMVGTASS